MTPRKHGTQPGNLNDLKRGGRLSTSPTPARFSFPQGEG